MASIWAILAQSAAIVPPFFATPSLDSIFLNNFVKGATILARKIDGSYVSVKYMRSAPYLASDPTVLADYLSAGVSNLLNQPAGPAGVSLASGLVAAGKFTTAGDPGVASISLVRNRTSVSVHRATLAGAYQGATLYTVGQNVVSVAAADFTGDGVADLVATFQGNFTTIPGGLALLTNKGDGTFNPPAFLTAGSRPSGMTVADLNQDGKPDLVVTDLANSNLYVFLGQPGGTFSTAVPYATSINPNAVITADFNKDGVLDIASTGGGETLDVLLGNGNGTFQPRSSLPVGSWGEFLAAGDFNKDGRMDIVVILGRQQAALILLGDGTGSFRRQAGYNVSYSAGSAVVTDYDQDGKADILIGQGDARVIGPDYDSQKIDVLLGRGDGTFVGTSATGTGASGVTAGFLAAADFNGDGLIDTAVSDIYADKVYIMNGTANSSLAAPTVLNLRSAGGSQGLLQAGVAGDFNGDGRADLAITEQQTSQVAVLLNSAGSFQPPARFASGGSGPVSIATGDFDGDGRLDLAVVNQSGKTAVFRGGGNGAFQTIGTYTTGSKPVHVAVGDLNGDGRSDIVVSDAGDRFAKPVVAGAIYVLLNAGNGAFQAPVAYIPSFYPRAASIGDLNGDGKADIVAPADIDAGFRLGVWLGNGNGTLKDPSALATDYGPTAVAIQDFNRDGKADLAVTHCCGDTDMTYYQGIGDGTFSAEAHFNGGADPSLLHVADVDKNGTPDLLVASSSGAVTVLLNTATSLPRLDVLSGASYSVNGSLAPQSIAVGFGTGLSVDGAVGSSPWPTSLVGTTVQVKDSTGVQRPAPLVYVFPNQISFLIPASTAGGVATVDVVRGGTAVARGTFAVTGVAPGLITANSNGQGVASAVAVRALANGSQTSDLIFTCASAGNCSATAIDLGGSGDTVVLTLYGTGIRGRSSLSNVVATAGGTNLEVLYAGGQNQYDGLDQVNVRLPQSLSGKGLLTLNLTVDGAASNGVQFRVK